MMPENKSLMAMTAVVDIKAAEKDENGESKGPPSFEVVAYTGKPMRLNGWDLPVLIDLEGMKYGNSLVANLDHDKTKRVGNVTSHRVENNRLVLAGVASAATEARREVVESADNKFVWQASIEANAEKATEIKEGESVTANGGDFEGPLYHVTESTLKGFGFVSHGADDDTTVAIAATDTKPPTKVKRSTMDANVKAWIEDLGFDADSLDETQLAGLTANYNSQQAPKARNLLEGAEAIKAENKRQADITAYALESIERAPHNGTAIEQMAQKAISAKTSYSDFRLEVLEASTPHGGTVIHSPKDHGLTEKVLEAAVCMTGRLDDVEKHFDERTLEAAEKRFKQGCSLNQLVFVCAESNGYNAGYQNRMNIEAHNAAFGLNRQMHGAGFSTMSLSVIMSNVANKFLRRGWDSVDMTPMRLASVRSVNDFKTISTVSLVGDTTFKKLGPDGEIKHAQLGETSYSNKADTYARMLAITRQDYINDDLGALTDAPRRLGRGAALSLNEVFWTTFLDNAAFFSAANNNVSPAAGIDQTTMEAVETAFMSQVDPDGNPLGIEPAIILAPTARKSSARRLMTSDKIKGNTDEPEDNIWQGRFRVESSPYMHNANYTGNSNSAWYLLADPMVMPVVEIAALNGRVEPVVETADASFNVLGAEIRGYSDVGVSLQEHRAGVRVG